jgi:transporter family-2 protein
LTRAAGLTTPLAVAIGVVSGVLIASQARINAQLGADLDQPVLAAVISNSGGLLVLAVAYGLRPAARAGFRRARAAGLPWWRFSGGAFGATLVAGAALVVPTLGVALFTVGNVAGQTVAGLAVDRAGLGPGGRRPVTPARMAGAALTVVAVVIAESGAAGDLSIPLVLTAAAIGTASAMQQALNGRVQQAAGDPLVATTANFVVGTAVLLLALGGFATVESAGVDRWPSQWWLYVGGLFGIGVVLGAVVAVRVIGVFRLGLAVIAGQLAGAVTLDVVVPGRSGGVTASVIVGVVLTFVAVALAGRVPRVRPAGGRGRLDP